MKAASAGVIALLDSGQPFEQFDLYTVTLSSGLVLRWANAQVDATIGSDTWLCSRSAGGVLLDSTSYGSWKSGMDVGTWDLTIYPRFDPITDAAVDKTGDLDLLPAIRAGILDEAICRVDRAYLAAWPSPPTLSVTPVGIINIFLGRVGEIDFGRSQVDITINDPRELLAIQFPRNVYGAQCRYALFDSGCTLTKASFAHAVAISGVTGNQVLNTTIVGQPDDYFALGEITFTSGRNSGLRQMIRHSAAAGGTISLMAPMPFTILNGDGVTLYPGCDKSKATCNDKFANKINFGGEPDIPAAETAV